MNQNEPKQMTAKQIVKAILQSDYIGREFTFKDFKTSWLYSHNYDCPILSDSTLKKYLESISQVTKQKKGGRVIYEIVDFARPARIYTCLKNYYDTNMMQESDEFFLNDSMENYLMRDLMVSRRGLYYSLDYVAFYDTARVSVYGLRYSILDLVKYICPD